jgi:hypothetical protein
MSLKHFSHGVGASSRPISSWAESFYNDQSSFGYDGALYRYSLRCYYPAGRLISVGGSKIRFTFRGGFGGYYSGITGMYIGEGEAGAVPYFADTPVQVTVGGSGSFVITSDNVLSDEISFPCDPEKTYLVSFCFHNDNYSYVYQAGGFFNEVPRRVFRKFTYPTCDGSVLTPGGYGGYVTYQFAFSKLEVQ